MQIPNPFLVTIIDPNHSGIHTEPWEVKRFPEKLVGARAETGCSRRWWLKLRVMSLNGRGTNICCHVPRATCQSLPGGGLLLFPGEVKVTGDHRAGAWWIRDSFQVLRLQVCPSVPLHRLASHCFVTLPARADTPLSLLYNPELFWSPEFGDEEGRCFPEGPRGWVLPAWGGDTWRSSDQRRIRSHRQLCSVTWTLGPSADSSISLHLESLLCKMGANHSNLWWFLWGSELQANYTPVPPTSFVPRQGSTFSSETRRLEASFLSPSLSPPSAKTFFKNYRR